MAVIARLDQLPVCDAELAFALTSVLAPPVRGSHASRLTRFQTGLFVAISQARAVGGERRAGGGERAHRVRGAPGQSTLLLRSDVLCRVQLASTTWMRLLIID